MRWRGAFPLVHASQILTNSGTVFVRLLSYWWEINPNNWNAASARVNLFLTSLVWIMRRGAKWERVKGSKIFTKLCCFFFFAVSPYFTNWVEGLWPRELAGKSFGNSPKVASIDVGIEISFIKSLLFTLNITVVDIRVVLFTWEALCPSRKL